ncbi:MAG TPA: 6,7-dimethyl-8-ribityllumazine synthase [Methylomirabilota bacterium]|nr:6,7-dimethyl-8-ribityllumazine synthase [Methylomirabilota bacterium]
MAGVAPKRRVAPAARGQRFAVVVARFNEPISKKLLDGALGALAAHAVTGDAVEVHWVPGSFELPQAALTLARTRRFAGVVCVGAVIKGGTPHFDYVCSVAAQGILRAGLDTGVPVTFGVITALTEEQAWERAGGAVGNRGEEAALAALEMAGWLRGRPGRRRAAGRRRSAR